MTSLPNPLRRLFGSPAQFAIPVTVFMMTVSAIVIGIGFAVTSHAAEGNAQDGEEVFRKCQACHAVGPAAKNRVGPVLNHLIGRKPGTVEGFAYSAANKKAGENGIVWTEENLFKYLEEPRAFIPGTTMAFAGLKDDQDRLDVIAYLKKFNNQ
jgi:cytochrome c